MVETRRNKDKVNGGVIPGVSKLADSESRAPQRVDSRSKIPIGGDGKQTMQENNKGI